ncbi:hypothetical protein RIF29_18206 [Crotalaria pallida]|uniref:Bromo domain-containing protein n=1 Tax=Crotalaria pallida TaxID=3830 RepID=A0AAN9IF97_CROPI
MKEGHRRSPRICALESNVAAANNNNNNGSKNDCMRRKGQAQRGPAFQTRARKKRKLRPLQQLTANSPSSPNQVEEDATHSHHQVIHHKTDQSSTTLVPEKRILQLVLDTLQRRDTYEIFAEPVDPNEVEDYYAIIQEPMDFGTMRAKLHEGMYKTLEQFEHDVFLIFDNAMHFNSAGTIYFRQARAINELSKKIFDLLRVDPDKFDLEFSETRRKVGRRNHIDFRDSIDMKSNEITIGVPSKIVPSSSHGTSSRKSSKANHVCPDIARHVDARDPEVPTGTKEHSRHRSFEVDRRCTYRPLSLGEDESMFSTVYGKLKQLECINQHEVGYRESLMLFVKDLGPTAQYIAKRKLLGCDIRTASTSAPSLPNTFSAGTALMSRYPLNPFHCQSNKMTSPGEKIDLSEGGPSYVNDKTDNVKVGGTLSADRVKGFSPLEANNAQGAHRWSFGCEKMFSNQSFCSDSCCSRSQAGADDLNCSDHRSKETGGMKSMTMLSDKSKSVNQEQLSLSNLKNFQANVFENKCKFQSRPWPFEGSDLSCFIRDKSEKMPKICDGGHVEAHGPTSEISLSSDANKDLISDQTVSLTSSFASNLPYLKTQLDHTNSSLEQHRFLQQDSIGKNRLFSAQVSNYQGALTNNPPTNLRASFYCHKQQR